MWYLGILLWFPLACLLVLIISSVFLCYTSMSRTGLRSSLSCLAKWPRHCRFQQSKSKSSWSTHLDEVHSQLFDGIVKHAVSLKSSCCVLPLVSFSFWYVCDILSPALWQWTLPLLPFFSPLTACICPVSSSNIVPAVQHRQVIAWHLSAVLLSVTCGYVALSFRAQPDLRKWAWLACCYIWTSYCERAQLDFICAACSLEMLCSCP